MNERQKVLERKGDSKIRKKAARWEARIAAWIKYLDHHDDADNHDNNNHDDDHNDDDYFDH